ncbi:response regulator transcription factor [Nocardioides caricicola]|uniref:Response regulator n=1 Tax=Nocardioides caricicola TaxID=634770 RepID=A0ABW0MV29_9ACTN
MPRGSGLTRITIVEDHDLFAEALEMAIVLQGHDVRRVSTAGASTEALLRSVLRQRPQIAILDLDLGAAADGVDLVRPLAGADVAVIVVSGTTEDSRLGECLQLGARGVVAKSSALNAILGAIRRVATGLPAMPREERDQLLATYRHECADVRDTRAALATLSRRESEVLGALMTGATVTDIAHTSYVSDATVRTQVKAIRSKLGVSSQLAAVGAANRARWQPPPRPRTG